MCLRPSNYISGTKRLKFYLFGLIPCSHYYHVDKKDLPFTYYPDKKWLTFYQLFWWRGYRKASVGVVWSISRTLVVAGAGLHSRCLGLPKPALLQLWCTSFLAQWEGIMAFIPLITYSFPQNDCILSTHFV